uniref:uncharacterized protein LOC114582354 isoform X1 n=1 Tax=Podarcis muralis TaxID=64176 RepID=UPI00109F0BE9|nr:uncharacterized protein LOC114582354 isoform X1 [Podarcis muralis]
MKNRTTSLRFPADVPCTSSPLPLLRVGMAPSWPYLVQKQHPKFPPIKTASQVISEREETLVSASVLGRLGRSPDAHTEEDRLGQLIRSGREPFPNIYFVLVKSLERCDDPQVLGQREHRGPSIVFGPSEAHSHMMPCFLHRATPPGMRLQRLLLGRRTTDHHGGSRPLTLACLTLRPFSVRAWLLPGPTWRRSSSQGFHPSKAHQELFRSRGRLGLLPLCQAGQDRSQTPVRRSSGWGS